MKYVNKPTEPIHYLTEEQLIKLAITGMCGYYYPGINIANFSITDFGYFESEFFVEDNLMQDDSSGVYFMLKNEDEKQKMYIEFNLNYNSCDKVFLLGHLFISHADPVIPICVCDIQFDNNEKVINSDFEKLYYQFYNEACEKYEKKIKLTNKI